MATTAIPYPTTDIDPFDEAFLDDPYESHAELRRLGAAVRFAKYPVWGVARYADVRAALNDHETFCSSAGVGLADFRTEKPWRPPSLLLEADPPDHTRNRHVVTRVLSPTMVRRLREGFAAGAAEIVAELLARGGEFDGMHDLAEVFPSRVFGDLIGLPRQGRENLAAYGNMVFNTFGPRNRLFEETAAQMEGVLPWISRHCERDALTPDGVGARIHDVAAAEGVPEADAVLLVRSLLTAGIDTTVQGIGAALMLLAENPDQFALLRERPDLARSAFEEAIRVASPVATFFRTTTRETVIGDVPIGEGEKVLLFLGSANRDPDEWVDADRYDINRRAAGHVGFGSGIHACVGQMIARLEGEVVLRELATRSTVLEPAGPPVRRLNNTLRSLESLPLRLRPAG